MYELSAALFGVRTPEAVAYTLSSQIQQLFQASLVRVTYRCKGSASSIVVNQPDGVVIDDRPDRIIPVLNSWGLVSEIQIWGGDFGELPPEDGVLFKNFATQAGRAFEFTQNMEIEQSAKAGG
jgi:hypothetical protein